MDPKTANTSSATIKKWYVLLLEDDAVDAEWVKRTLAQDKRNRFELEWVTLLSACLDRLGKGGIDIMLMDMKVSDGYGLEIFEKVHGVAPHLPKVCLTGTVEDEQVALKCIERGAQDYHIKGQIDPRALMRSLQYAIEHKALGERLRITNESLKKKVKELEEAHSTIQQLHGLIPICTYCKKIRNDKNYWEQVDSYISKHSEAAFTHSYCPDCYTKIVSPQMEKFKQKKGGGTSAGDGYQI